MSNVAACTPILLALDNEEGKEIMEENGWMKEWLKRKEKEIKGNKFTHENLLQELLLFVPAD